MGVAGSTREPQRMGNNDKELAQNWGGRTEHSAVTSIMKEEKRLIKSGRQMPQWVLHLFHSVSGKERGLSQK